MICYQNRFEREPPLRSESRILQLLVKYQPRRSKDMGIQLFQNGNNALRAEL